MLTLRASEELLERHRQADLRRRALIQVEGDRAAGALAELPAGASDVRRIARARCGSSK